MKTNLLYIVFAVVLLTAAGWAAEADISRISLEKIGDETVCIIYADGPFQYTHEIPEQLPDKPYRVLVDIFPAVHNLDSKQFANLPASVITSIRSSQYAVSPEKIMRIVFDLKEAVPYRIEKKNNQVWVYLPDKNSAPFPQWTSWQNSARPIPERTALDKPLTITRVEKTATEKPATAVAQITPEKPQMAKNEVPLMGAPTENKSSAQKTENPPVVQKSESSPKTNLEQSAVETPPVTAQTPTRVPAPKAAAYYQAQKSTFLDLDKDQTLKWVNQAGTNKPVEIAQSAPAKETPGQKASEPPVPVQNEAVGDDKTPAKTNEVEKEIGPAKTEDKEQDTPFKKSKPVTAEEPSTSEEPILAGVEPTQPDTAEIVPESAGVEESDKPTSRFRRQPTLPAKLKGTIVAEFPTRMVIKYNSELSRDPFKTLIDETRKNDSQMQKRIPDIETLRLVGVIESANGKNRALLEDIDGFGYILGEGDKVKKGFVSRIDSNKAFFQLYEYGWSRTVALHLGDE